MTPEEQHQLHVLCHRVAGEEDPIKFLDLVQDLNEQLEAKTKRLTKPQLTHLSDR